MLKAENIKVEYFGRAIADSVSFEAAPGERIMIVGPNGAGKSTVVRAITGAVPYSGKITLGEQDLRKMKAVQTARKIGVLTQNNFVGYAFSVEEVVRLGRYAYRDTNSLAVDEALARVGLSDIRGQSVLTLSGGELQRTFLAQVFAQNPEILILDEPTNHLDITYQKRIFELLDEWLEIPGKTLIAVVHDLSLAKIYGTRVLLMNNGKIVADGKPEEALSPENLTAVYGMDVGEYMKTLLGVW
ncbi:MAG: ABC transporter ATP-binding protein [Oscillospiraceae bacterium]|jgi:iron complex transport system ATP-binding protein|nr:ABC transporter ATP-binding protein [Oscillospiraceae bacterium]